MAPNDHDKDDQTAPVEIRVGPSGGNYFKRRPAIRSTILSFLDGKAIGEADAAVLVGMCGICMEKTNMIDGNELKKLENCAHTYHKGRMAMWVKRESPQCILCRKNLALKIFGTSEVTNG